MTSYYLRVEAVNMAHFVYDTHDISTMRGGSYTLLEAIEEIKDEFKSLKSISTAASQGLFTCECPKGDDYPERLCQDIIQFLDTKTGGHATFVIAMVKGDHKPFPQIMEELEAEVHRQQWRLPTVAVPEFQSTDQECYLDGWRPGTKAYRVDPNVKHAKISPSTQFRRESGRTLKHQLFYKLLQDEKYQDNLCAKDLSKLAEDKGQGILDGKIAYIYIDGNNFGKIRRKLCSTPEKRSEYDAEIQGFRKAFLAKLLHLADQDPAFKTKDDSGNEALRLEILEWGGDEMTLVVPAWKGLEVMQLYFDEAQSLKVDRTPLSQRAVVIFCHNNMPILQVRQIAEHLLQQTKRDINRSLEQIRGESPDFHALSMDEQELMALACDHQWDAWHYLVLESFDMLGGSLEKFLTTYYLGVSYDGLLLKGDEISKVMAVTQQLKANLAYGKVLEVIECLQEGKESAAREIIQRMLELVPRERRAEVEQAIESLIGNNLERWYILADLWNYVTEG